MPSIGRPTRVKAAQQKFVPRLLSLRENTVDGPFLGRSIWNDLCVLVMLSNTVPSGTEARFSVKTC